MPGKYECEVFVDAKEAVCVVITHRCLSESLAGVLSGTRTSVYGADDFVGGEMQNGKWMRQGNFKAVSVSPPYGAGTWHLYNLEDDPGETRDLGKEQPLTLDRLIAAWDRYAEEVGFVLTDQRILRSSGVK